MHINDSKFLQIGKFKVFILSCKLSPLAFGIIIAVGRQLEEVIIML